ASKGFQLMIKLSVTGALDVLRRSAFFLGQPVISLLSVRQYPAIGCFELDEPRLSQCRGQPSAAIAHTVQRIADRQANDSCVGHRTALILAIRKDQYFTVGQHLHGLTAQDDSGHATAAVRCHHDPFAFEDTPVGCSCTRLTASHRTPAALAVATSKC